MVVLEELTINSAPCVLGSAEGFQEESTLVPEYVGLDDDHAS
jgi:hypothetical protein